MAISSASNLVWMMWTAPIPSATISIAPGSYLQYTLQTQEFVAGRGSILASVAPASYTFSPTPPAGVFLIQARSFYYNQGPVYVRMRWQVPVANSGQLGIQYSTVLQGPTTLIPESVVGTSYGHCQLIGDYILMIPNKTQYFVSIVNPAVNDSAINLMSHGSGNLNANFSIMFEPIQ